MSASLHPGMHVIYEGRTYHIISVRHGLIGGPHYRLGADGDYPGEDLTSYCLISPADEWGRADGVDLPRASAGGLEL